MHRRRLLAVALATAAALALCACTPGVAPSPTPTSPFADKQAAFAAAEATYRAYVDAGNQVDLSQPKTFETVFALTTGAANASERKTLSQMAAKQWRVSGSTRLVWFRGVDFGGERIPMVSATACIDVSDIALTDSAGVSQVKPDRLPRYAISVEFVAATAPKGLKIAQNSAVEDPACE